MTTPSIPSPGAVKYVLNGQFFDFHIPGSQPYRYGGEGVGWQPILLDPSGQPLLSPGQPKSKWRQTVDHMRSVGGGQLKSMQLADYRKTAPVVDWLIEGLLPSVGLSLFYSPPKRGKTTMLTSWLKALETGEPWAGQRVKQAATLYLSEENASSHTEPIDEMGLDEYGPAWFYSIDWRLDWDWDQQLRHVAVEAMDMGAGLIVVDTLGSWADLEESSNYGSMTTLLRTLAQLSAELEIAELVVHHSRKGGGDGLDAALGSTAIVAGPSTVISLTGDDRETLRSLTIRSRFRNALKRLTVEKVEGGYIATTKQADSGKSKKPPVWVRRIPELFCAGPDGALSNNELVEAGAASDPPISRASVQSYLREALAAGRVVKDDAGRYTLQPVSLLETQG